MHCIHIQYIVLYIVLIYISHTSAISSLPFFHLSLSLCSWFKEENEQLLPLQLSERITIVSAGLLKITKVCMKLSPPHNSLCPRCGPLAVVSMEMKAKYCDCH